MSLDWMKGRGWRALACALSLVIAPATVAAQEYEPYDEDEWWDPTDWFDGNNVEWDDTYEWYDEGLQDDDDVYGYDDGYYDDDFYDYYDYDEFYDYGYDDYYDYDYDDYTGFYDYDGYDGFYDDGYDYGWHYEWDPTENEWSRAYGWYDEYYDDYSGAFSDDPEYGWHYEWDSVRGEWDRVYGWYDEYYESDDFADRYDWTEDERMRTSQRQTTVTGTIDSFRRMSTENENLMVRLRMRDGSTRVVDLGPNLQFSRLDLDRGDSVTVRGDPVMRQGDRVLRASMIEVAGRPFRISRTGDSMEQRGQTPQRQRDPQQQRQREQMPREQQRMARDDQSGSGKRMTFEGRLEGFKKVGTPEGEHTLVRLKMQDGSKRVVDFGSTSRFRELGLEQGDRVTVRGETRKVQGEQVLVADQVNVGGQRAERGSDPRQREDGRTVSGEVLDVRRTRVEGLPEDNTVVRLRMEGGRTHVVDLGPSIELGRLDIGEGDQVRISGRSKEVRGRTVIDASSLRLNGRSIALEGDRESGRPVEAGSRRPQN